MEATSSSYSSQIRSVPEDDSDASDDELFAQLEKELDDELDLGALREQRLEELQREMNQVKDMREQDHGRLAEITDEKEAIRITANEKRCIIHFYHRDFKRCEIMNKHLEVLASKYFATRFLRVFVESVPWLVEKLGIKVLPCVICFIDGVSKDRLIGFEEIGNSDGFETVALELRLQMSGKQRAFSSELRMYLMDMSLQVLLTNRESRLHPCKLCLGRHLVIYEGGKMTETIRILTTSRFFLTSHVVLVCCRSQRPMTSRIISNCT
ncbi:thioredoxin-like protein [Phellopilus nigrolimitatus]|nr:thioredoxin-like protein [Phellopilus nigrolimitatus]